MQGNRVFTRLLNLALPVSLAVALLTFGSTAAFSTQVAATPTFSPKAGPYTSPQSVVISDTTANSTIYYTTNGSAPTTSSTPYTGPIAVSATETIKAIAKATNYTNSAVATAAYTINLPVTATPTFSPKAGTYTSPQSVAISNTTANSTIYYTTNGGTPTTSSTPYAGPITVSATETIKAIAKATNYTNSAVGTAAYTINLPVAATPTFTPKAGTYTTVQSVAISDTTANSTIYYTTNGSAPTISSTPYTGPITVSATETIKAIAAATNYTNSAVGSAAYTINLPPPPTIGSMNPNSAQAGASVFSLIVTGTNFTSATTVNWNSNALPTTFVSATSLTARVAASLVAGTGTASVTISNGTSTTSPVTFTINPASSNCTADGSGNARLKGNYAFQFTQVLLSHGGAEGFLIGSITTDGNGNITSGLYDSNDPGSSKPSDVDQVGTFTGTYSVGSDNRGVMTVSIPQSSGPDNVYSYCIALDSISNGVAGAGRMVENDGSQNISSGAFYAQGGSSFSLASSKGSWVFGMQGGLYENGQVGRTAQVGYLTLDGSGKITAGENDFSADGYDSSGSIGNVFFQQTGFSGTYTLNSSTGRGVMTIIIPSGKGAGTYHEVFYVAGSNHMLLLGADAGVNAAVTAGDAYLRTTTTFSNATLSGPVVFLSNAASDHNSSRYDQLRVEVGVINSDGKGNMSGSSDVNNAGSISLFANDAFTATYSVDSNGRVTTNGGPVFYLIGTNQGFGVVGDPTVNFVAIEKQTVPSGGFSPASFNGSYSLGTLWYDNKAEGAFNGEVTSNGAGVDNAILDLNASGYLASDIIATQAYSSAANGRFLLNPNPNPTYAIYFVSSSKAYMMNISNGGSWMPVYVLNHQ